jgi:hypothetical protein
VVNIQDNLRQVFDRLYGVFSRYSLHNFLLCTHCYSENEQKKIRTALQSQPLRKFPETRDDLSYVIWDLPYVSGQVNNYKYFLPRLLEIALAEPSSTERVTLLANQFIYLKWQQWPSDEREIVLEVLKVAWEEGVAGSLAEKWDEREIVELLIAYDVLGGASEILLKFWDTANSFEAGYQLANFIYFDLDLVIASDGRHGSIWRESPATKERLKHWLLRDEIKSKLETIYLEHPDKEGAVNILNIITVKS